MQCDRLLGLFTVVVGERAGDHHRLGGQGLWRLGAHCRCGLGRTDITEVHAGQTEPVDIGAVRILREPADDRGGDHVADTIDSGQLLDRLRHDRIEGVERIRQRQRCSRPEVTNPERGEQLRQRSLLRLLDLGHQVLRARRTHPIEADELLDGEGVEVSRIAYEPCTSELLDHLLTEALDVHAAS